MSPMMLQTDRDIRDSIARAWPCATPERPASVPWHHYEAIKRLAEAGDALAKAWLPRIRRAKSAG